MQNRKIGLLINPDKNLGYSVSAPYVRFANRFGQVKFIDALDEDVHNVDLLILPGGADVNSMRYGEKPWVEAGAPNHYLEWFDTVMLQQYIDAGIPIFGICRGFQTLNVHFGGSLIQDMHQNYSTTSRTEKVDEVIASGFVKKYYEQVPKSLDMKVNSLHHQGFDFHGKANSMRMLFTNKTHHNIEAIEHETLPIVAVQWHPEEIYDQFSINAIKYLLNGKFKN